EVTGEVVADARTVEEAQQRRDVVQQVRGQPARLYARPRHRFAGGEVVDQAVAVLVDLLGSQPGHGREDDKRPRPRGRLHDHRDAGRVRAGGQLEQVEPRVTGRGGELDLVLAGLRAALLDRARLAEP